MQKMMENTLLAMLLDNQSSPSYKPSPEVAQVLCMYLNEIAAEQNYPVNVELLF